MMIFEARQSDLKEIIDIYNYYILHSPATFELEPVTIENKKEWFLDTINSALYDFFVYREAEKVVGYVYTGQFNSRSAYSSSAEVSIYLDKDSIGHGIGNQLMKKVVKAAKNKLLHRLYAGITLPNEGSINLFSKHGFNKVAFFSEVGYKFGSYHDVAWFEFNL